MYMRKVNRLKSRECIIGHTKSPKGFVASSVVFYVHPKDEINLADYGSFAKRLSIGCISPEGRRVI